ncbi:uncharacterized protein Eint_040320 [Encephalitozoon intestinalis ATCC 50506]|uniref:SLC41A/MgtE integral membrane domain-containing protein n=1 Tax=Encephalitozoon intestinalis (strain ATCC 50506) TaxID=876142 RepID=E0S6I8_ENCIT|nr:uncharacterized protein Eint_040320 [Encephalitozoon intestinalis ATCC 50506]ADM11323.1 hypothetical protein Eint_040320 [Encephalitozoon intestinalis ATCC 50506]UTX45009.1 divalent cation transporter [Encephalitozoon intestinalis]
MFGDLFNMSLYDSSLLIQSIPGLLISLSGLILMGSVLIDATDDPRLAGVPVILEANCILAFKGNIELTFAMYLSSMSQSPLFIYRRYFRYVFDNSSMVLAQSVAIGLVIGLIGMAGGILSGGLSEGLGLSILAGALVSCILTSILFIILLVISIELSKFMDINPDNIILPTISSFGDYTNVRSLVYFTKWFRDSSPSSCLSYIFLSISLMPLCLCFVLVSKKRIPLQPVEVLLATYGISTASGYVLETFSTRFPVLAPSFPVFGGMSVSIAFIYLHRIFTSINNRTIHNSRKSYITLVLASILMSLCYLGMAALMGILYSREFCVLFIISFVFQVTILLSGISLLVEYLDKKEEDTGVLALPLISSISDLLSTGFLITICVILDLFDIKNGF